MQGNLTAADVQEGFRQREQEEHAEEDRGCRLVDSTDGGHGETHDEGGETDDEAAYDKDSATPAMPTEMARADALTELQWAQDHEEHAGHDVSQRQEGVARENAVESRELGTRRIWRYSDRVITMEQDRNEDESPAKGDDTANEGEEDGGAPKYTPKADARFHIPYYGQNQGLVSHG